MSDRQIKKFYQEFHQKKNNLVNHMMEQSRYRLLRKSLKNVKGRILVIGCGSKDEMGIIPENVEGWGLDISEEAIKRSQVKYPHFHYQTAHAESLPYSDQYFDVVVCSEVIEHVTDQRQTLSEIKRVLKNDGRAIITTPNWWSWYGLMRKIGEFLFKWPLTSDDQPIDKWSTPISLRKILSDYLKVDKFIGFWYYPPFGKGRYRIPAFFTTPFVVIFWPLELMFRHFLPWFGHVLIFYAVKNQK